MHCTTYISSQYSGVTRAAYLLNATEIHVGPIRYEGFEAYEKLVVAVKQGYNFINCSLSGCLVDSLRFVAL